MNREEEIQSNDHQVNECIKDLKEIKSEFQSGFGTSVTEYNSDSNGCSNCDSFHRRLDNVASKDKHENFNKDDSNYGNQCVSNTDIGAMNTCKDNDEDSAFPFCGNNSFNDNIKISVGNFDDKPYNDTKLNDEVDGVSEYFTCEDENDGRIQTVDDSRGEIVNVLSPVQLFKCSDLCSAKQYKKIMKTLEEFQTESKWDQHARLTSGLHSSEINLDLKIVLFLEEGMAQILQKNFSSGKKLFRKALQLCSQSKNSCLLQGRSLMFLGNAYRKEGPAKYGKAFKCLTLAEQNLSLVESKEDKAEVNYFLGVFYLNMLNISTNEPSQRSRDRVEKHYQAVYDYAMAESASRVREKVQKVFPLGMANFLLDGQTELARSRTVVETKVKRAEDCLKYFIQKFPFDEQPITMKTDYCKSMSDLQYRKGNLYTSQEFLIKGLKIAKIHGYHLEVQSLEKRLSLLEKCLPRVSVCLPLEDTTHLADSSSTADSELNVFCSGSE